MRNMSHMRARTRNLIAATMAAALVAGVALPSSAAETQSPQIVPMTLDGFDPGNIIDDSVFFSSGTMSTAQIQAFLNGKVPSCRATYVCLKDFAMATTSRPADAMCRSAYTGRARETAAEIIFNVSQACGINPQVILVMLQKEQALVTHTWPSEWRYTSAMGQGCPDTAACDARYHGFFNQVYGAAWQLKRYANPPGTNVVFTWFAPGRVSSVRYHPNEACGSSPTYIANQATANLYYYTPYRPNAAALRAGYGAGDSCSAYGNRNFYNYFTDWFGSTRAGTVTLAKSESSETVWVVSQGNRWALADVLEWNELNRAFGPTFTVSDTFLSGLANRGLGSNIVRDPSTGAMGVVSGGSMWQLPSCASVASWGGTCANPIDLAPSLFRAVPKGPMVGDYLRMPAGSRWGRLESGTIRVLFDSASATRLNHGVTPAAPTMSPRVVDATTKTAVFFSPGELVRTLTNETVYMTDGFQDLVRLTSFNTAVEMGLDPSRVRFLTDADLSPYASRSSTLAPLVGCGTTTYFPAGGKLYPLANPGATGLATTPLRPESCSLLDLAGGSLPALLVKSAGDVTVYTVAGGVKIPLTSWSQAVSLGGAEPTILTMGADWLNSVPTGPVRADGTLLKGSAPAVYILNGGSLLYLPSFALSEELGLGSSFTQISDAEMAKLGSVGAPIGLWSTCAGKTYFSASRVSHEVSSAAGFPVSGLSPGTCARLDLSGTAVSKVFVKGSGATVYVAMDGTFRPIGSWPRLISEAGGVVPTILRIADATLAGLPKGTSLD